METQEQPHDNASVERIMYLPDGNVLVMEDTEQPTYQEQLIDCDVAEEIITEQWGESCPEEIGKNFLKKNFCYYSLENWISIR